MEELDRIERQVSINAPAQRVWDLVSEPGWYINDGAIVDHRIDYDGEVAVVTDPRHGTFRFRTVTLDPPNYAAFRWINSDASAESGLPDHASTLVEFWIEERAGGGVILKVAESGFASLGKTAEWRRQQVEGNTKGWELELGLAAAVLDPARVS